MSAFGVHHFRDAFPFSAGPLLPAAQTGVSAARPDLPQLSADTETTALAGLRLLPLTAFIRRDAGRPPQPRTRPDHTLIWATAGEVRLDYPRNGLVLGPGDLRLIPAGTAFAAMPAQGAEGHVALIATGLTANAAPKLPDRGLAAHVGDRGPQLLTALTQLADEATCADAAMLTCLVNLLSLRLHQLDPAKQSGQRDRQPIPDRPLLERFLALAATRLGDAGSLADLAEELDTTVAALDRACIAGRGRRAVELVHQLRLERAVDLLRNSRHGAARIAADLGYSSHAHFTRAFIAATGRTPEAFRAQSC